jgi:hypothetical protein
VTYSFSLQDAGGYDAWDPLPANSTAYGLPYGKQYYELFPVKMVPGVSMPGDLTIEAGETATAEYARALRRHLQCDVLLTSVPDLPLQSPRVSILRVCPYTTARFSLVEATERNWVFHILVSVLPTQAPSRLELTLQQVLRPISGKP